MFAALEVSTTYQSFYHDVIQEITASFIGVCKPLTNAEWSYYNVKSESKKAKEARLKRPEEIQMRNLNKKMQEILVGKVYNLRPFNLNLPQKSGIRLPSDHFTKLTSKDKAGHWFTHQPFYHCFQHIITIRKDFTAEND